MPMNRSLYPANWDEIALKIKRKARWTCQNCDRPCRKPGESIAELASRVGEWPDAYEEVDDDEFGPTWVFKRGRFTLTVAHLDHDPWNCRPRNLKALCSPCHCRYDLSQMARKKMVKLELAGQLRLFGDKP
jgi:hypothetical protein